MVTPIHKTQLLNGKRKLSENSIKCISFIWYDRSVDVDKKCLNEIYVATLEESIYDTTVLQGIHCLQHKVTAASLDPRYGTNRCEVII